MCLTSVQASTFHLGLTEEFMPSGLRNTLNMTTLIFWGIVCFLAHWLGLIILCVFFFFLRNTLNIHIHLRRIHKSIYLYGGPFLPKWGKKKNIPFVIIMRNLLEILTSQINEEPFQNTGSLLLYNERRVFAEHLIENLWTFQLWLVGCCHWQ